MDCTALPELSTNSVLHKTTGSFSKLVADYLAGDKKLKQYYDYPLSVEGVKEAIENRKKYPVDRKTLVNVLLDQYRDYELTDEFKTEIHSLASENTFTICTAHQPDLMTGYLYFFFKIIHTVKLSRFLKEKFPNYNFVPIFYIGSEDNDIEELSVFNYGGKPWHWKTQQTGAVGRMDTKDLQPFVKELVKQLIPPGENQKHLSKILLEAYNGERNISEAIRYITHNFLGRLGVVVVDADDIRFKRNYISVMKEELLRPQAAKIIRETTQNLQQDYMVQAYAREINLFYLKDDIRERIEQSGEGWKVVNTKIRWENEEGLIQELNQYPDRFSPNVILRGPFQETILPDVAFIGGGSEVAYWMEVKKVYEHYKVFFPVVVLRQSAMWMDHLATRLQNKLDLSDEELFLPLDQIQKGIAYKKAGETLNIDTEIEALNEVLAGLKKKAGDIDPTLYSSCENVKAKTKRLMANLQKKMIRAQKRHLSDKMRQSEQLKTTIFPEGSLQERHDCFISLYLIYGERFIDYQYDQTLPFGERFLIIKEQGKA